MLYTIASIFMIFLLVAIVIITYLAVKKRFLIGFSDISQNALKEKLIKKLRENGYKTHDKGNRLGVEKDSFIAADIHFEQIGNDVNVYRISSITTLGWILVIIGIIIPSGGLAIILMIFLDYKSRGFAKEIIYPFLEECRSAK